MNPPDLLWLLTSAALLCLFAAAGGLVLLAGVRTGALSARRRLCLLGLAALALLIVYGALWPLAAGAVSGQERLSACGPGDRSRVAMARDDDRAPRITSRSRHCLNQG